MSENKVKVSELDLVDGLKDADQFYAVISSDDNNSTSNKCTYLTVKTQLSADLGIQNTKNAINSLELSSAQHTAAISNVSIAISDVSANVDTLSNSTATSVGNLDAAIKSTNDLISTVSANIVLSTQIATDKSAGIVKLGYDSSGHSNNYPLCVDSQTGQAYTYVPGAGSIDAELRDFVEETSSFYTIIDEGVKKSRVSQLETKIDDINTFVFDPSLSTDEKMSLSAHIDNVNNEIDETTILLDTLSSDVNSNINKLSSLTYGVNSIYTTANSNAKNILERDIPNSTWIAINTDLSASGIYFFKRTM